jgi:thiol-disulfide isomerase/thioredoxin
MFISLAAIACKTSKQALTVTKDVDGNLVGIAQKSDFEKAPHNTWFLKNYKDYTPDIAVINQLKPLLNNVKIKAVMGTWCGDSRRETPHFYKVLEAAGFDFKNLTMITVNRSKATPDNDQEGLEIERVPTFIFYKNGQEINRFVEYPRETLEKDFLRILQENGYKHSYLD